MKIFGIEFWHKHEWEDVLIENFIDTSYGMRMPRSKIVQKCNTCKEYRDLRVNAWIPELNTEKTTNIAAGNKKIISLRSVK